MADQWFKVKDGQYPELDIVAGAVFTLGPDGNTIHRLGPDRPNQKVFVPTVGGCWSDYTDLDRDLADIRAAMADGAGPESNFYWITYGFHKTLPAGICGRFGVLATARLATVPEYLEPIGPSYREGS